MQKLNLPEHILKTRESKCSLEVFDHIRGKWVVLTPEERVRQGWIHTLTSHLGYNQGLICIEYPFTFPNGKQQRADIVIHDRNSKPYLLVECKAPSVKITEAVFRQTTRYNSHIQAPNIIISNGLTHFALSTSNFIEYTHLNSFPTAK